MGFIAQAVGGLVGSAFTSKSQKKAAQLGNQGFDYLKDSPLATVYGANGARANQQQSDLLGVGGDPTKAKEGFQNYLGSTGYQFQLNQGSEAITNNNASRGLLNSGATLKGLNDYGQNQASTYFNNYLSQLGGVAGAGQNAYNSIGSAATSGGQTLASGYGDAAQTTGTGIGNAIGTVLGGIRGRK